MRALPSFLRKQLESAVLAGRRASEGACRSALEGLGVFSDRRPEHLGDEEAALRNGLRAKWRQLGNDDGLLVSECAYEQWHRLLFARFLAENSLLLHPQFKAPVTLEDCEDLAAKLGESDGWAVAARFAAEILPGIFRLDDPCVRLRLAPEGKFALEEVITGLPAEVFAADDALGWVYQFWQKDKKDEINNSERKIGGADLGPVTQLFTENYMVRFLLENSLGAWWASRHPDSPIVKDFEYLRFDEDNKPAAGAFDGWPKRVAEVTVMDPCCGSGHFLVEAFGMLWQMRAEQEGLSPVDAQDAVLRDNLFGLELDARCVQIAMFAVALQAWKAGGGWRQLPVPNIACSGLPVRAPVEEWKVLALGDQRLENALARLHVLFRNAETLGSLIDPRPSTEIDPHGVQTSLDDVQWEELGFLVAVLKDEKTVDPATAVFGASATGVSRAADYLSRTYTLVSTNPPFLGLERMSPVLESFVKKSYSLAKRELALCMFERARRLAPSGGALAFVLPADWTFSRAGRRFRERVLDTLSFRLIARLGARSFTTTLRVSPLLVIAQGPDSRSDVLVVDASSAAFTEKPERLMTGALRLHAQSTWKRATDFRFFANANIGSGSVEHVLLGEVADARNGMQAGDGERFERYVWEIPQKGMDWEYLQSSPEGSAPFGGMAKLVLWEGERGAMASLADSVKHLNHAAQNWRRGKPLWGRRGIVVSQIGAKTSLYCGDRFDSSCFAVVPNDPSLLPCLAAFGLSGQLRTELARVNPTWRLGSPKTLLQLEFDRAHFETMAAERFADGLPEPWSDDPTQWLFEGRPEMSTAPLQVAVGRLLGYRWPEQSEGDDLDAFADDDGIVCLPSVAGEPPAANRLQQVLAAAFGEVWSSAKAKELLEQAGSKRKNLDDWLQDEFFKQHCALFENRPFVWHIWDGQRDGFSALVNYHRLNRQTLEKLIYTYLGQDWVERQRAGVRDEVAGADGRLRAALALQQKLEAILEGENPFDIYVRWKQLHEQSIGWEPDLNDGVRLNIRPFVEAGVLRVPFNIHWKKDRGKNPDGTERFNDIHLSLAEKLEARRKAG